MTEYKNILISGGAGFIGSRLALELIKRGYRVRVLDNMSEQIHGSDYKTSPLYCSIAGKVDFVLGDVRNKNDWTGALENIDAVVHLAAETGTGQSMYEIEKYTDVNIKGTSVFLDILANGKHCVKKMVVASSRAIYGEGKYKCRKHGTVYPSERKDEDMMNKDFNVKCPLCNSNVELLATDENSKIHPSSVYGITKQVQEQLFMLTGKSLNIPAVAFRYQNVYGPGQSLSNPYTGILSIFSTIIKNGNNINIFEDGEESRDFVYIDDVVDATIQGIEKDEADNEIFNVGTGIRVNVTDVAAVLKNAYQSDAKIIVSGNYRLGDIRHNYADLTKIKSMLGFSPKTAFTEGIQKFVNWVNTQEVEIDIYEKSMREMSKKGLYK